MAGTHPLLWPSFLEGWLLFQSAEIPWCLLNRTMVKHGQTIPMVSQTMVKPSIPIFSAG
jgi:hypothetical protein